MLKELLFGDNLDVLEEDAGNLKQIPRAWWKAITKTHKGGGEASEIVEIGSDIFKKSRMRGGEAYYSKPKDKANEFIKTINNTTPKLSSYTNPAHGESLPIAAVFVKIDDQPYALINYQAFGGDNSEKYEVVYHTGEQETVTRFKSNKLLSVSFQRTTMTHEEFGKTLPDGKCDVYMVMTDINRIDKMKIRRESRMASKNVDTEKILIQKRSIKALSIADKKIQASISEISDNIKTAFETTINGGQSSIDYSILDQLKLNISSISEVLRAVANLVSSGKIRNSYNPKSLSYEYERFSKTVKELENPGSTKSKY